MIEREDVIAFSDTDKVIVLDVIEHEGQTYAFVNEVTPDETDVTDKYSVMRYDAEIDSMTEINDKELINKLLPLFSKNIGDIINSVFNKNTLEGQQ